MLDAATSEPFWGEHTATVDWCETNYAVCRFIAEFWNTTSNLALILPALFGIAVFFKYPFEKRFLFAWLSLLTVGVGSWCFHMTLRYDMQLLDELPMIWGSCIFLYCTLEVKTPRFYNHLAILLLIVYSLVVTFIYIFLNIPVIQNIVYGFLAVLAALRMFYLAFSTGRTDERKIYGMHISADQRRQMQRIVVFSGLIYLGGFVLWNIDNVFCAQLTAIKRWIGPALAPFFEFHALWHLFTGTGCYLQVLMGLHYRALRKEYGSQITYLFHLIPYVKISPPKKHH